MIDRIAYYSLILLLFFIGMIFLTRLSIQYFYKLICKKIKERKEK